ncbi:DUF2818 family protein [Glaciimonas soli]|uniref:DUF2818 family protein n=1 Tax=Glaciimonas soli TaxID=2590999 RepID=A0A843YMI6_9BURK|nr:DUF2818 family protein [Glaciimonas soli]MQQ99186.1 DUF2818 family protein [Glaciimonas soli]
MNVSSSSWIVILLAVLAANLPFINERLFALIPLKAKSVWLRIVELFVLYALVGVIANVLESRLGNAFTQTWEFYAITACLFLVLAFPGFVYRYLRKKHS